MNRSHPQLPLSLIWPLVVALTLLLLALFGWHNGLLSIAIIMSVFISLHGLARYMHKAQQQTSQLTSQSPKGD